MLLALETSCNIFLQSINQQWLNYLNLKKKKKQKNNNSFICSPFYVKGTVGRASPSPKSISIFVLLKYFIKSYFSTPFFLVQCRTPNRNICDHHGNTSLALRIVNYNIKGYENSKFMFWSDLYSLQLFKSNCLLCDMETLFYDFKIPIRNFSI